MNIIAIYLFFPSGVPRGPLDGIPFAAKDNFCTEHTLTTCASRMLKGVLNWNKVILLNNAVVMPFCCA